MCEQEVCMDPDVDVVIVGGGPIGLAHAFGIKRLNPLLNVVVFEKYEEYQRKHSLIMQHQQLKELMRVTETEKDATLSNLLIRLEKDPNIRTNVLEGIFKQLAKDSGVTLLVEEVQKLTLQQQLFERYPLARLIIGADGTHSVISEGLFPEGNQIKHEFDYVLQLRYEIDGEEKAEAIHAINFYQHMARQGLIANEYVGHFEAGKTPVTMQMMISKQDYVALRQATSKNPLRPFDDNPHEQPLADLPTHLSSFINKYLAEKIKACQQRGDIVEAASIRISVNEAPATHARQVAYASPHTHNVPTVLVGDAGLGLSYFKGLNAGLQSTAALLSILKSSIRQGFQDRAEMDSALKRYETWFLEDFSPKKINEVAQYSTWRIRSAMRAMKAVRLIKMASMAEYPDDPSLSIKDYFKLFAKDPLGDVMKHKNWQLYPHRGFDPVKLGQFAHIPAKYTVSRIAKSFVDYVKPYKSTSQLRQDFKQPLVGVVNFSSGLAKFFVGAVTLDGKRFGDGVLSITRGALELATTPIAWVIKPLSRGAASLINGKPFIEDNKGIKKLAQKGQLYLAENNGEEFSPQKIYEILAVCNDLHRKYAKANGRGQSSKTPSLEEYTRFNAIRADTSLNRENLNTYFSLFRASPKSDLDVGLAENQYPKVVI